MSVRGFPPKYRFLTPGHLRLAHQISKVGENLAHLNTRKKWFACHVQIAGRRTNEEEDESEENGVRQVGPRIGAWACARDAPSFLSVVARHSRHAQDLRRLEVVFGPAVVIRVSYQGVGVLEV